MRDINQSRLKYFEAVFSQKSVRGAADILNTAPSVVTRQITLLEEELGLVLFERQTRGMKPNEAAIHVMDYWRSCRAHRERLTERLDAIDKLDEGSVRIVLSEGYVDHLVSQVIGPFCSEHPKLNVAVDALPVSEIMSEIADDSAHIGLAYNPQADARISFVATVAAPAKLLVRAAHPLTNVSAADLVEKLREFPIALMPPGYGVAQLVEALEYSQHIKFRSAFTSSSIVALKQYVRSTEGVAFMGTGVAVASELANGELVLLDIDHPLCTAAKLRLLVRRGRPLPPAASRLLANIKTRLLSFGG
ncbi:LysR substrate-binding domain-containing protein [Pararhizobium qamdonense]|uniref:LysR substrate-binding domain-containing protein n=1 Tax=Pararhizobium qamdonense TaxID=3031126 RepID=UPI0023E312F4|nr:LysR substrate-binding domain-containing protein [Pararhizobium qamdonense]